MAPGSDWISISGVWWLLALILDPVFSAQTCRDKYLGNISWSNIAEILTSARIHVFLYVSRYSISPSKLSNQRSHINFEDYPLPSPYFLHSKSFFLTDNLGL